MSSIISEGVQVSVVTFYQPDYSNPIQSEFMFAYRITLENHNAYAVKLHRRNWQIFDSNGRMISDIEKGKLKDEIDVRTLSAGMYVLLIKVGNAVNHTKIVLD